MSDPDMDVSHPDDELEPAHEDADLSGEPIPDTSTIDFDIAYPDESKPRL